LLERLKESFCFSIFFCWKFFSIHNESVSLWRGCNQFKFFLWYSGANVWNHFELQIILNFFLIEKADLTIVQYVTELNKCYFLVILMVSVRNFEKKFRYLLNRNKKEEKWNLMYAICLKKPFRINPAGRGYSLILN
jgi:hypothetical protein